MEFITVCTSLKVMKNHYIVLDVIGVEIIYTLIC